MAAFKQDQDQDSGGYHFLPCVLCCLLLAAGIAMVTIFAIACTSKAAVYSVTVTGVAGLVDDDPALSPVFNLTVRIDNSSDRLNGGACIDRLSTAVVSYGDAPLGRGSVPQFCAGAGKVRERGARAWAQGVVLPPFLRDQLAGELAAGEAAVDVKVTTPAVDSWGDTVFVCSQAKIGGGPAPCRKEHIYHPLQVNSVQARSAGATDVVDPTAYIA